MRGPSRWSAVLAVVAIGAMVCGLTLRHTLNVASLQLQVSEPTLTQGPLLRRARLTWSAS